MSAAATTTATALSNEEENIPIELTLAQSSQTGDNRSREESQGALTPRTLVKAKEVMRRVTEKVKKEEAAAKEAAAASENVQQPQIVPPEVKKAPVKIKLVTSSSGPGAGARAFEASSS